MHGCLTRQQINELWARSALNETGEKEIPRRTFCRHREAVEQLFGIEVRYISGAGYSLNESSGHNPETLQHWMLEALSIGNLLSEYPRIKNSILLEEVPSSRMWLRTLIVAIDSNRKTSVRYRKFNGTEKVFTADPLCLKLFRQRWYLLAGDGSKSPPRVYALDRIEAVSILPIKRIVPKGFDADEWFANYYGVFVYPDREPQMVKVRVSPLRVPFFRTVPLHSSQEEIETDHQGSIFRFYLVPTLDFMQELLACGSLVEVLEPESLRVQMRKEVEKMAEMYGFAL